MATTSTTYTGNGSTTLYTPIGFDYLDTTDVDVYLNGVLQTITTNYSFANATTIQFVTAPGAGAVILFKRSTADAELQATFFPGSAIKADDLNQDFKQVLYIAQETANDAASQSTAGLQTQITAATNTANSANTTANNASATANGIAGTANTALANANTAISTANAASVTATNAETTANAISATASSAVSTANAAQSTANTANTTANAALPKAGGTMTGVITYAAAQPRMVLSTSVASTSGTSIDFTSIPSWAKQVTVMLYNVSTNGAVNPIIQLGSGSFTTSGYSSGCGSSGGNTSETSGFIVSTGTASSDSLSGSILFSSIGISNRWVCSGTTYNGSNSRFISGNVSLSGALDRVRITTIASASTFDGGTINIIYEG